MSGYGSVHEMNRCQCHTFNRSVMKYFGADKVSHGTTCMYAMTEVASASGSPLFVIFPQAIFCRAPDARDRKIPKYSMSVYVRGTDHRNTLLK